MAVMEILGILLGMFVLGLVVLALRRGEFDDETPKYEMLGMEPPPRPVRRPGRLSIENRIIRLGLVGAAFYYAARIGWESAPAWLLAVLGAYFVVTGLWGRDPFPRARRDSRS